RSVEGNIARLHQLEPSRRGSRLNHGRYGQGTCPWGLLRFLSLLVVQSATEETGLEVPVTQQPANPSSASVERARAEASVEHARAERYKLRQREIRRGARAGHGRARPSEFEARGF